VSVLLHVSDLEVAYGPVRAVKGVGLELREGQITTILGANGAGKSSVIKAVMGLVRPRRGTIEFPAGRPIHHLPAHKVNAAGIALVPEGRQVFATLTVMDNLLLGAFASRDDRRTKTLLDKVLALFPRLASRRNQDAGLLSGGEQQMLAIGRALMSEPRLLLMDEPSLGLAPKVVQVVFDLVLRLRDEGISVLMADQNAHQALRVADYVYLMEVGELRASGPPSAMAANAEVRQAYLGG
jgi:branched-chain amino acid transport system ATP-binding protein